MIREIFQGLCMAFADSVPGVSGGTIAFIMGFYEKLIGSVNALTFGTREEKKKGLRFLLKLGLGWIIGMVIAVLLLTSLFENHIYEVSSLFIGFILGSIPIIYREERATLTGKPVAVPFFLLGAGLVIAISYFGSGGEGSLAITPFSLGLGMRMFVIGMIAISAMFLPGISGSTLLLIMGAYIPIITGIRNLLSLDFSPLPALIFFGFGVIVGTQTVVKGIDVALKRYRPHTIAAVIGMMVGSLYPIAMGPTTLDVPRTPLSLSTFSILFALIGLGLVLGLQKVKVNEENARPS